MSILSLAGCGDSADGSGGSAGSGGLTDAESACELADAAMVTAAFEGTASEGVPGDARNCRFALAGGEVESVNVFYFGDDSSWERTRQGFEDNTGGTTDVPGLGDEAFYSNNTGPYSLVVRANGIIFQVSVSVAFITPSAGLAADVEELARAIVES